jgi:hypothetical protein
MSETICFPTTNAIMSRALGDFNRIVLDSENNDATGQGKADRLYGGAANAAVWKDAASCLG